MGGNCVAVLLVAGNWLGLLVGGWLEWAAIVLWVILGRMVGLSWEGRIFPSLRAERSRTGRIIWNWSRHVVYCTIMSKKTNIITIDLNEWTTQTAKAKAMGLNESTIRQRVLRTKQGKGQVKEEHWIIPELNLTLVKR